MRKPSIDGLVNKCAARHIRGNPRYGHAVTEGLPPPLVVAVTHGFATRAHELLAQKWNN